MDRKREIRNSPVYAEVLIKMGDNKVYASEFVKQFSDDPLKGKPTYTKTVATLHRQLHNLEGKGYVKIKELQDEEKNFTKNKKYFSIVWERVTQDFLDRVEHRLKKNKKLETLEKFKPMMSSLRKNKILQTYIQEFLGTLRSLNFSLTLNKVFDDFIERGWFDRFMEMFERDVLFSVGYDKKYYKHEEDKEQNLIPAIEKALGKEYVKDFKQLVELNSFIGSMYSYPPLHLYHEAMSEAVFYKITGKMVSQMERELQEKIPLAEVQEDYRNTVSFLKGLLKTKNEQEHRKKVLPVVKPLFKKYGIMAESFPSYSMRDLSVYPNLEEKPATSLVRLCCEYALQLIQTYKLKVLLEDWTFLTDLWSKTNSYALYKKEI